MYKQVHMTGNAASSKGWKLKARTPSLWVRDVFRYLPWCSFTGFQFGGVCCNTVFMQRNSRNASFAPFCFSSHFHNPCQTGSSITFWCCLCTWQETKWMSLSVKLTVGISPNAYTHTAFWKIALIVSLFFLKTKCLERGFWWKSWSRSRIVSQVKWSRQKTLFTAKTAISLCTSS